MPEGTARLREHGSYWLTRHGNGRYYIWWYDEKAQQSRKRSLKTDSKAEAVAEFDRLAATSVGGDPDAARDAPVIVTVADLIGWHAATRGPKLAAKAQMTATVKHVVRHFGRRGVSCLGPDAVDEFTKAILAQGLSLGYAARIVAVLRAAVRAAHERELIPKLFAIPNPQSKAERDATPRKGRPMTPREIARLIDAMPSRHMVRYVRLALATVARRGAILDLRSEQYHDSTGLLFLNGEDRVQTSKYRPTVIAIEAIRPWLRVLPPGVIVSTDLSPGVRVMSIKTAWRASVRRAGLDGDVTTYSVRYSVAMHMRASRVPTEQISLQLGHQPVDVKATTLIYSPYDPDYLQEAAAAVAGFYEQVDALVTNPLWRSE